MKRPIGIRATPAGMAMKVAQNHRQEPGHEDDPLAVLREEPVGQVEVVG